MWEAASTLVMLAVFLGIYELLRRRAAQHRSKPPVHWGWLAAIVGLAALAYAANLVTP